MYQLQSPGLLLKHNKMYGVLMEVSSGPSNRLCNLQRSENQVSPRRLQAPPQPYRTLREQQVLQLQREMKHPSGVRLQLRKKDCISSIALVDAMNAVW